MDNLQELRNSIDNIDDKIIELLEERFLLTKKVGLYKKDNNIKVESITREEEILKKIDNNNIKELYKQLFLISKQQQKEEK